MDYFCRVNYFGLGHTEMGIEVSHNGSPNDTFMLVFRRPWCFSGLMRWHGVGLRTGDEVEYDVFIAKMRPTAPEQLSEFAGPKYNTLYIFEAVDGPVQLLAYDFLKVVRESDGRDIVHLYPHTTH